MQHYRLPFLLSILILSCPGLLGTEEQHVQSIPHTRAPESTAQHAQLHFTAGALDQQARLLISLPHEHRASLDLSLADSNGRWWRYHAPLRSSGGTVAVPLAAEYWAGPYGPMQADALATISRVSLQASAPVLDQPRLASQGHTDPAQVSLIRLLDPGFHREGAFPWYTLRLQVLGHGIHSVELIRPHHRRIPAFRTRLHSGLGPQVWQVRLRPDEIAVDDITVVIRAKNNRILQQSTLPLSPMDEDRAGHLSSVTMDGQQQSALWPLLHSDAFTGLHFYVDHQGQQISTRSALPPALAPILRWRDDWSGFVGPRGINTAMAQALDQHLAIQAVSDIDLLPDFLWRDEGIYRFANAPWHSDHGGPLHHPMDSWDYPGLWGDLRDHARDIIARSRATPQLKRWRLSCRLPISHPDRHNAVLHRIMDSFAELVSRYDHRPLHILHPASIPYRRMQADGLAILESDLTQLAFNDQGSARSHIDLDQSLWSWERARYQVENPSDTGVSLYAWMSDRHHRYFQQRIAYLPAQAPPQVVEVWWGSDADWQAVGHDLEWDISLRDRVRQLGLLATADSPDGAGQSIPITTLPLVGWAADPPPQARLTWMNELEPEAQVWRPYSLHFTIEPQVDNPYDPEHADVMAELIDPHGERHSFPAFWLEPHTFSHDSMGEETVLPSAHGHWAWRYAFSQPGTWRMRMRARLDWRGQYRSLETPWHEISVSEHTAAMLPIEGSEDVRYWQTSDGSWWYPMGITLRSPGDSRQDVLLRDFDAAKPSAHWQGLGTEAYAHWFAQLAEHGGNFARIWMSPWWTGLEWHRSWDDFQGLGRYNQANAARMDRLVNLAAEHGIYLQIELLNHGMTSESVDEQWHPDPESGEPGSPYNAVNGGPVARAAEFFSDEDSWTYHRNRLRYTVARWGHAPQIMAWVLSSEMEFTGAYWDEAYNTSDRNPHSPTLQAWIERNLQWFSQNDHHQRPVSVHFSHPWRARTMWRMDGLGFSYSNAYTGYQSAQRQLGGPRAGLRGAFFTYLTRHFPAWDLGRPTLLGEWGGHWMERDPQVLENEFAPGIWMQAVLPFAGNTGFWWWLWVDASDSWRHFAPVRRFIEDMDPRGEDLQPMLPQVIAPQRDDGGLHAVGSRGNNLILCYLYDSQDRHQAQASDAEHSIQLHMRSIPAQRDWRWFRYDAHTGTIIDQGSARSSRDGTLLLSVPEFTGQAAWRLEAVDD
ncbi:MAG: hypothetical protein EA401_11190 [Planctomycetota bacterium]|nr:MAG: hypothetical protein EA401_11190 [Planctomycetota bacterium]